MGTSIPGPLLRIDPTSTHIRAIGSTDLTGTLSQVSGPPHIIVEVGGPPCDQTVPLPVTSVEAARETTTNATTRAHSHEGHTGDYTALEGDTGNSGGECRSYGN